MTFLVFSLCILLIVVALLSAFALMKRRESNAALTEQAGEAVILGKAAQSLETTKMRMSNANREKGIVGEVGVGQRLEELATKFGLTVIHDLSIPGRKSNIDHILISRKAIFVIDAKNYKGKVSISRNTEGIQELRVGGYNRTNIANSLRGYAQILETYLNEVGIEAKVVPMLAFYKATFEGSSSLTLDGVSINLFGVENEVRRYATSDFPDVDMQYVAKKILERFPHKA